MVSCAFSIEAGQNDPASVERLLKLLPDWFGIEESVNQYVRDAANKPTYLARDSTSGSVVGALLMTRHTPLSAEIHLMAVDPAWHRRGVGAALVAVCERDAAQGGAQLVEVKTQGPSQPDQHYAQTLKFYEAMGFIAMEEIIGLWPENPCLIMVKPIGATPSSR